MSLSSNHPPIDQLHQLFLSETQSFRKVHRMIDLFETLIKSHTVLIIAEYVRHNTMSEAAKGLLAQGLRTPSLGIWQLFSRVLFEELQKVQYEWLIPEFPEAFTRLDEALNTDKTNVIAFRNGYAHGATPLDEQCEADVKKFEPFLNEILQMKWLHESELFVSEKIVYIKTFKGERCLHPVLLYRPEATGNSFAFFNDLKNDKVGLLNYPHSKHYREKEFYKEFHEFLPLHEWKKSGNNEFHQRIEELTETFKGRTKERKELLQFVLQKQKGYCSIQGNPGIGKSALIAQFFKDLSAYKETQNLLVVEYFIRRGTQQAQVEYLIDYLIKKTDEHFPAGREIRAEGKMLFDLQNQLFSKWRLWAEQGKGQKLLFLIDGLDEGVENDVAKYMPRENFENILFIYGSRPGGHQTLESLWRELPVEHHQKIELTGLSKEDIRALIYEVANKYEIPRESEWIDAVQQRSQGNPLYLKLLCSAIENGSIALNDVKALPKEIDEYYKAILSRYAQDVDGDALLNGLYTFAAAKDYLTMPHLALINHLGDATLHRIGSTLNEVLYENPLTEEVLDYQLFHESFRAYLIKEKRKEVADASYRIIDFCTRWKDLEGSWEQHYALKHYAVHLYESKKEAHQELLLQLMYDVEYVTTQKKVLKGFDTSNQLYRLALLKASELNKENDLLEAALCLVDLKYEEANDAPKIVEMVANGEIDLALKRIESFGGNDKEGIKRKFILYMLCLMELTILGSKEKPFRKYAIEKLLNHLDEQIPSDTSLINWNGFFSSYLMFLMVCQWSEMGLDYLFIYRRTKDFKADWIKEKGTYNDLQFRILLEITESIIDNYNKGRMLQSISCELAKQGKLSEAIQFINDNDERKKNIWLEDISIELAKIGMVEKALYFANLIGGNKDKISILKIASTQMAKQGNIVEADNLLIEALELARGYKNKRVQSSHLADISGQLRIQEKFQEAALVLQESFECTHEIIDEREKSNALGLISIEIVKQGKVEEAITIARSIIDQKERSKILESISFELYSQGKIEDSKIVLQESIDLKKETTDDWVIVDSLKIKYTKLINQGRIVEAIECVNEISDNYLKSNALNDISIELRKKGFTDDSTKAINMSLFYARNLNDNYWRIEALEKIFNGLAEQEEFTESVNVMLESLQYASGISEDSLQNKDVIKNLATQFAKRGMILEALKYARSLDDNYEKSMLLKTISSKFPKYVNDEMSISLIQEALKYAYQINGERYKFETMRDIIPLFATIGNLEESLRLTYEISNKCWSALILKDISAALANNGETNQSTIIINKAIECTNSIIEKTEKSRAVREISIELAKQRKIKQALEFVRNIEMCLNDLNNHEKDIVLQEIIFTLSSISTELYKQGQKEYASQLILESFDFVHKMSNNHSRYKDDSVHHIIIELLHQGNIEQSLDYLESIKSDQFKFRCLKNISIKIAEMDNWPLAEKLVSNINKVGIRHSIWKSMAKSTCKNNDCINAIRLFSKLQNDEAKSFYLKGVAESIQLTDADKNCLKETLPLLIGDSDSIEVILQAYSQHEVFFNQTSKELVKRFNRTLNIQWALDIVDQFSEVENTKRCSTNLEQWIHEIADEDDREEIKLLSKKVSKGKMTEEEFGKRVKELIK